MVDRSADLDGGRTRSEAVQWDARLRSQTCTDVERAEFKGWCEADPRNREAFERLQISLTLLRDAASHPQLRALRERARASTRRSDLRRVAWRSAAGIAVAIGIAIFSLHVRDTTSILSTGLHERRTVSLADGSSVTLNASTQLETEWLPRERRIRLLSGQALFRVAKDSSRPFVVTVGEHTVTALGTEFDVKLEPHRIRVTLVEGSVAVRGVGKAAGQPTLQLKPHEQLVASDADWPRIEPIDLAAATGWAEGQLFFKDESLASAVAEMNRNSAQQIVIGDQTLLQYRVSGMFRTGNQDGFVAALSAYYPIDYRRESGRIILRQRSGAARPE